MKDDIVFCKGGGCTAKLGPGVLDKVLNLLPRQKDENLLVGFDHSDDAAVYRLTDDLAIVQTLDFFPPMVDDPYLFGKIAAANALSDVYAMGGQVKTALNIVCFPAEWDLNILGKILQGGAEKVAEAGGVLAGGHSIQDADVKYGLSVTGVINPRRVLQNNDARPGDRLLLTKPLGVGLVCCAARLGAATPEALAAATGSMQTLNKYAAEVLAAYPVHGCTDVTGFGLLGHLCEMLGPTNGAELAWADVPRIPEAERYAADFYLTAAAQRNRNHVGARAVFEQLPFEAEEVLFDPQTSGGLLVSLPPEAAADALAAVRALGLPCGIIGTVTDAHSEIRVW